MPESRKLRNYYFIIGRKYRICIVGICGEDTVGCDSFVKDARLLD